MLCLGKPSPLIVPPEAVVHPASKLGFREHAITEGGELIVYPPVHYADAGSDTVYRLQPEHELTREAEVGVRGRDAATTTELQDGHFLVEVRPARLHRGDRDESVRGSPIRAVGVPEVIDRS